MSALLKQLIAEHPQLNFAPAKTFMWSPVDQTIHYCADTMVDEAGVWSLLHELGHALLEHKNYRDDLELMMMEVAAWGQARRLATSYDLVVDEDHIERCLESYRSWLHHRSICPDCSVHALQRDATTYQCHNCNCVWEVPLSKLCRPQRRRVSA